MAERESMSINIVRTGPGYTVAQLQSGLKQEFANAGDVVWTTDGIAGSAGLAVFDGTNFVHVADGTTTVATS